MLDPEPPAAKSDFSAMLSEFEPSQADADPAAAFLADEPELIDPEDVAFESEPDPEPERGPVAVTPEPPPAPPRAEPTPAAAPRPAMSVAHAAPLPDPKLSEDMAEELLAPTTNAAIQGSISRLSAAAQIGGMGGQTVEGMMREMLRPMLKDWLDENLPALVERMVEKEIARISRGVK
jgi:cell pole-organizing protein PopZ